MSVTILPDTRPLPVRVKALADRFAAQSIGYRKRAVALAQDALNADRDAQTLYEAVKALEARL